MHTYFSIFIELIMQVLTKLYISINQIQKYYYSSATKNKKSNSIKKYSEKLQFFFKYVYKNQHAVSEVTFWFIESVKIIAEPHKQLHKHLKYSVQRYSQYHKMHVSLRVLIILGRNCMLLKLQLLLAEWYIFKK